MLNTFTKQMDNLKVFLETRHVAVRESVYTALAGHPGIDIVEGLPGGAPFAAMDSEPPAIAILDIDASQDSRPDTIYRIREQSPSMAVLLVSESDSDDARYAALKSGADAFLTLDRIAARLGRTIEELSCGYLPIIRVLLRPDVASLALDEFHDFLSVDGETARPDIRLSFQQRTVLQYVENRHSVPQLVANLGISQGRVIEHLEGIREKLTDIDEYLRPPLPPVAVPEAEEEIREAEVEEAEPTVPEECKAPEAIAKAKKLPVKLNPGSLGGIAHQITAYPQKLYKGIFRPTVSKVIILFIVMIIGFFLSIHLLPGHNMYVVSSESMEPTINMGDIIVTQTLDEKSIVNLAPGDIITFEHGKNTVTHRLLSIKGDVLTTKGDAAEESDPWTITLSDVKDVYLFRIPLVGYIPQLAKEKLGWFLMIVFPAVVLVALLVKDIIKEALRKEEPAAEKQGGGAI